MHQLCTGLVGGYLRQSSAEGCVDARKELSKLGVEKDDASLSEAPTP